jgi:glycine hydroxymethyltransferase
VERSLHGRSVGRRSRNRAADRDPGTAEPDNRTTVNLVASETYCPAATLAAETSELVNKNAGGYPPRVSFNGGATMDAIERLAIERAKGTFGAEHANIQSLSATIANIAVLRALLQPGDRLMGFGIAASGHNSHGDAKRISGTDYAVRSFGVDEMTGAVDYEGARRLAREFRPHMIVAGSSSYPMAISARMRKTIAVLTAESLRNHSSGARAIRRSYFSERLYLQLIG